MNKPIRKKVQVNRLERRIEKLDKRLIKINKEKQFLAGYIEGLKKELAEAPQPYVKGK